MSRSAGSSVPGMERGGLQAPGASQGAGRGETPRHPPPSSSMQSPALPAISSAWQAASELLPLPFLPAPHYICLCLFCTIHLTGFILLLFLPSVSETSSRENDF